MSVIKLMIPREGIPQMWIRFLHDALFAGMRLHRGSVGLPQVTTAERDALYVIGGEMVYNTTTSQAEVYENGSWRQM